jgi:uncharacterized membrane protein YgdD (TMEM256/DUF423 family)
MTLNKNSKKFLAIATFLMAINIAIGAFGAHGLKAHVAEALLDIYHTGVEYQFYNTLGLFALALIMNFKINQKKLVVSSYLLLAGMLIFSFSLYLLVLLKLPILGAITPIGGTLMIVSWLIATYSILKDD